MRCDPYQALAVAVVILSLGCQRPPQVDVQHEAATIRALSRQWQAAVDARDLDACLEFYAPGAIEMQPNAPAIAGLPAIRAWFDTGLLQPGITNSFAPDTIEVAASGDLDRLMEIASRVPELPTPAAAPLSSPSGLGIIRDTPREIPVPESCSFCTM